MANLVQVNTNIRMSQDTKDFFDALFNESGTNSKGEFIATLLDRYENPPVRKQVEKIVEIEKPVEVVKTVEVEKLVEVEKQLQPNQLLLTLSDAELFALRETVLSFSDFAERQNKIIDSLSPEHDSIFAERHLHSPEIHQLWRRFEPISENMTDEEREKVIKSNIPSCLFNSFLQRVLDPDYRWYINKSLVTLKIIREYIKTQSKPLEEEQ